MRVKDEVADKDSRRSAFITPYWSDEASRTYALSLRECFHFEQMSFFVETHKSTGLPTAGTYACWSENELDQTRCNALLSERQINSLHISSALPFFGATQLNSFLKDLQQRGIQVVFHFRTLDSLKMIPPEILGASGYVVSSLEENQATQARPDCATKHLSGAVRKLKVLMQNRPNALSQRGGDTVLMERIAQGLQSRGVCVELDLNGALEPKDFDLVHLCNFATPEITEKYARLAWESKVPYLVTTLYEDWPCFYHQMHNMFYGLKAYVEAGQPREKWRNVESAAREVEKSRFVNNAWTAKHAAALLVTGSYEASCIERDYPEHGAVYTVHVGSEISSPGDGGRLFRKETGLSDFVLCVGRLECRKNQLMLLKALEDSEITLVFAAGGFTYQPEYEEVCRRFSRKGKTVFLDRLSPEMLASAYSAARVHALPSWFELPGLVSLEAAEYGANIVAGDKGTTADYFGDYAFYCSPDDSESVRNAVLAAYYAPRRGELENCVKEFSWDRAADETLAVYQQVLGACASEKLPSDVLKFGGSFAKIEQEAKDTGSLVARIPEVVGEELSEGADVEGALKACDEAAELLKSGRQEQAQAKYRQAIELNPQCAKAHRGAGVVELSMENYPAAEAHFKRALRCQPNDVKALLGLGAVDWAAGRREEAFQLYLRAAETDSRDPSTILYLVNAAYVLERYKDLEHALRRFLMTDRGNLSIQYCLAGCYFKQKKYTLAAGVVGNMLRADPAHMQALELREEIERIQAGAAAENVHSPAAELEIPAAGGTPNLGEEALSFQHLFRRANSAAAKLRLLEEAKRKKEYAWVVDYAQEIMQSPEASASERVFGSILKAEARGCLGELEEADRLFYSVQEDQTYGYRALSGRGAIAAAWGQWREAKELFESSLAAEPEYDVALAGLGICYENLGQRERAWDLYQHALRSNSENIQALHGIIQLGYVLDRLPQSELALSNYLDIHPVDFSIVYSYAGCLYSQGKTHEAQDQCRKILIFEPEHALALELLDKIREEAQVSGDQRALGAY